jgi:hypothetical protein
VTRILNVTDSIYQVEFWKTLGRAEEGCSIFLLDLFTLTIPRLWRWMSRRGWLAALRRAGYCAHPGRPSMTLRPFSRVALETWERHKRVQTRDCAG